MEKIEIKDNPLKLKIYINGKPDLSLMPKDLMDALVNTLTEKYLDYLSKKRTNVCKYDKSCQQGFVKIGAILKKQAVSLGGVK